MVVDHFDDIAPCLHSHRSLVSGSYIARFYWIELEKQCYLLPRNASQQSRNADCSYLLAWTNSFRQTVYTFLPLETPQIEHLTLHP